MKRSGFNEEQIIAILKEPARKVLPTASGAMDRLDQSGRRRATGRLLARDSVKTWKGAAHNGSSLSGLSSAFALPWPPSNETYFDLRRLPLALSPRVIYLAASCRAEQRSIGFVTGPIDTRGWGG